jgi:hypothetical protein
MEKVEKLLWSLPLVMVEQVARYLSRPVQALQLPAIMS